MLRLRAVFSGVYRRLPFGKPAPLPPLEGDIARMTQVTSAIHQRQLGGQTTSLRQLHKICNLDQSEALSVLAQLRNAELVSVEQNMVDEFESLVVVNEDASRRLAQVVERAAA